MQRPFSLRRAVADQKARLEAKKGKVRVSRKKLEDLTPMLLPADYLETDAGKEHLDALHERATFRGGLGAGRATFGLVDEFYDFVPWLNGKEIPKEGGWIMVKNPPNTEITVPPLSLWYAINDWMEVDKFGFALRRVRVATPAGPVWIFPHEYERIPNITRYVGLESEGCPSRNDLGKFRLRAAGRPATR